MLGQRPETAGAAVVVVAGAVDLHDLDPLSQDLAGSLAAAVAPVEAGGQAVRAPAVEAPPILRPGPLAPLGPVADDVASGPVRPVPRP